MKYKVNHTTNGDGTRVFVLIPASKKFAGKIKTLSISTDAPEHYLAGVWGTYSTESDAYQACSPFLKEWEPSVRTVTIPLYRTRPSSTGIGWVALQVWNDAEGSYVHAGSYRSEEEALKNAPSSK